MLTRRSTLIVATLLPAAPVLAQQFDVAEVALRNSQLIYLTPIKSDGTESSCKGELWFFYQKPDIWVVTQSDAWRADAIRKGMSTARIWIGEFGIWQDAGDAYRSAPELMVQGEIIDYMVEHESLVDLFGPKYVAEWDVWGPRWKDSLASGGRVLIRYRAMDA